MEQPISFFSRALRDAQMRYDIMEKMDYALVKSIKSLRVYILHSKIISYVPLSSVEEILIQPNIYGKRSKWIAKILEFDIEMKPTKLVKGQCLDRLLSESNSKTLGVNFMNLNSEYQQADISVKSSHISPNLA
jgi:hypothetical protein